LEWDASCDNHDGTESASGTKQYNIRLNGSPVETIAATACSTPALTETIIGASDGTPDSVQTGNDWALSFGGAGFDGTTDNALIVETTVAGDAFASARVTALTGGGTFAKIGYLFNASNESGSAGAFFGYQKNGTVILSCRTTTGGTRAGSIVQLVSLPFEFSGRRTLATNTISVDYRPNGGSWSQLGSCVVPMASAIVVSPTITGNSAGVNATGTLENVNIHAQGRVSRDVSTMSGGPWTVSVDDNDDNESAFSAAVSASPAAPPEAGAVKWSPGHYMLPTLQESKKANQSLRFGYYDAIASNTAVKGSVVYVKWGDIETTNGNYTAGIAYLQAEINKLKGLAVPKRLWVRLTQQAYGANPSCNNTEYWPAYVTAMGGCAVTASNQAAHAGMRTADSAPVVAGEARHAGPRPLRWRRCRRCG
jgi:hypothetical protein